MTGTGVRSSLIRFQRDWAPEGLRFAAHLPFYPSCLIQLIDEEKIGAPIRIFHGTADDWSPIGPCREYVERVVRAGADVKLLELPGALHAFDVPSLPPWLYLPKVQNGSRCRMREETPGAFVETILGRPASGRDACVTFGATVGYDAGAHRAAISAVKEFLAARFGLSAQATRSPTN